MFVIIILFFYLFNKIKDQKCCQLLKYTLRNSGLGSTFQGIRKLHYPLWQSLAMQLYTCKLINLHKIKASSSQMHQPPFKCRVVIIDQGLPFWTLQIKKNTKLSLQIFHLVSTALKKDAIMTPKCIESGTLSGEVEESSRVAQVRMDLPEQD